MIEGTASSKVAKVEIKTNCGESVLEVSPSNEQWMVELNSPSTLCVPLRLSIRAYSDNEMKNAIDSLSYQVGNR